MKLTSFTGERVLKLRFWVNGECVELWMDDIISQVLASASHTGDLHAFDNLAPKNLSKMAQDTLGRVGHAVHIACIPVQ